MIKPTRAKTMRAKIKARPQHGNRPVTLHDILLAEKIAHAKKMKDSGQWPWTNKPKT